MSNFPTVTVRADNLQTLEKSAIAENYFSSLKKMFSNYFTGYSYLKDVKAPESVKEVLSLKFDYYLCFYNLIQKNWEAIEALLKCFELSKSVNHPGELLILVLQNDVKLWDSDIEFSKARLRTLNDAWYEYQKCLNTQKYSKKLETLINRLKRNRPIKDYENDLIFQMVLSCLSSSDKKDFENSEFPVNDYTNRQLRKLSR